MGKTDEQRRLIALRLKNARESRKLTQAQLADMLSERGISMGPSTIAKIETGRRGLEITEALAMVDALDLRWKDLEIKPESGGPSRAERLLHQAQLLYKEYLEALHRAENVADSFMDIVTEMTTLETSARLDRKKAYQADNLIAEAMKRLTESEDRFYSAEVAIEAMKDSPSPEINPYDGTVMGDSSVTLFGVLPLHMRLVEQPFPVDPSEIEDGTR